MGIFIQEHAYSAVKKKKKNERIHDTQNNLNKSQNHDVASKKPDTEEYVLYVCVHVFETQAPAGAVFTAGNQSHQDSREGAVRELPG